MKRKTLLFDFVLLFLLLVISLYPRLWNLELAPRIIVDEPAYLRDIHGLLEKGMFPLAEFQWDFSQATLFYFPTLLLAYLLRTTPDIFTLRLSSVVFSLAALIPFYFLTKQYTNRVIAFCVTFLFSFSYYYLQFSRVGWGVVHTTSLGLYLIWFLQHAVERRTLLWFILAGAIAGIILYGYRTGEIYVITGFFYLAYHLVKSRWSLQKTIFLLIFLDTFLLTSSPWLAKIINNWKLYNLRLDVVSVLNTNRPYHNLEKTSDILNYQIITMAKAWFFLQAIDGGGIENSRYLPLKDPPVNLAIRVLFSVGLVLALLNFKKTFPWWIIFILGLVFGQVLTVDPPNGARGLILLPVIYLFSALALEKIYQLAKKNRLVLAIILVLSFILAYTDFLFYQDWMRWIKV